MRTLEKHSENLAFLEKARPYLPLLESALAGLTPNQAHIDLETNESRTLSVSHMQMAEGLIKGSGKDGFGMLAAASHLHITKFLADKTPTQQFNLQQHLDRLKAACEDLNINLPVYINVLGHSLEDADNTNEQTFHPKAPH